MLKSLRQRALCTACCTVSLVALGTALPASASRPTRPQAPESASITISLSDLALNTPQGLREARGRLVKASQHLCRQWADERKVDNWASYSVCTEKSLARALRELECSAFQVLRGRELSQLIKNIRDVPAAVDDPDNLDDAGTFAIAGDVVVKGVEVGKRCARGLDSTRH